MRRMWVLWLVACGSAEPPHVDPPTVHPTVANAAADAAGPDAFAALVPLPAGVWRHDELVAVDQVCFVRSDGRVACWGTNSYGEVGDEPRTPHPVPILVPTVEHAVAVAAGPGSTCAILADHHVACWGAYDEKLAAPHRVDGISDVVEVIVLSQRTCARDREGGVWCWQPKKPPARIAELGRARRLVGGYSFACVIGDDDRTHCITWWAGKDNKEAYQVLDVTDAAGAVQLAAAYNSTCAVLHDGRETCWTLSDSGGPPELAVYPVAGVTTAIDVAGNNNEMCVATRSGEAQCRVIGRPESKPAPWANEFRAIAIGPSAHCGVHPAGDVVCWGNDYASLGRYSSYGAQATPAEVAGVGDAEQLSLEDDKTCVRRARGVVTCWSDPKRLADVKLAHATQLRAGHRFTCAEAGGKTVCWGVKSWQACRWHSPDNCQIDPFTNPTPTPKPLEIPNVITLADPCAIDASEHVKCRFSPTSLLDVTGVEHVISASAQCAVSRDGKVGCWGVPAGNAPLTVTAIEGTSDAVQVVSGTAHHCAREKRGTVACWGKNRLGQLGDGKRTSRTTAAPVKGLTNVVELAAGLDFTCARTKAGAVWCWGANASGALGDGSGRDQLVPVRVSGIADAVELVARNLHACVRRKNHHVACWGHTEPASPAAAEERVTVPEPETIE